jgi:hypothetical protein
MQRWILSLGLGSSLVACLVIGVAGSAAAATLDFTGTLTIQVAMQAWQPFIIPGAGTAQVTDDGSAHLLSLSLAGGTFGPASTTIDGYDDLRFTSVVNLSGVFTGISGGPPGGGAMGLAGIAKICLIFEPSCQFAFVPLPLAATGTPPVGLGIGGTQVLTGAINFTAFHAPWTIGQPVMTLHTPNSTISTPALPGGFAHGPASLTTSTAQPSGAVQLVTVSKVFTSLTGAYPEIPMTGVLTLHFVPEPGTLLLLGSGVAGLAAYGRRRRR